MTDTDRKQKMLQEIIEEAQARNPRKREDEFTVNDFAKRAGLSAEYAQAFLDEKVAMGVMRIRQTTRAKFYSLV
jgi:hypothetical protein